MLPRNGRHNQIDARFKEAGEVISVDDREGNCKRWLVRPLSTFVSVGCMTNIVSTNLRNGSGASSELLSILSRVQMDINNVGDGRSSTGTMSDELRNLSNQRGMALQMD